MTKLLNSIIVFQKVAKSKRLKKITSIGDPPAGRHTSGAQMR